MTWIDFAPCWCVANSVNTSKRFDIHWKVCSSKGREAAETNHRQAHDLSASKGNIVGHSHDGQDDYNGDKEELQDVDRESMARVEDWVVEDGHFRLLVSRSYLLLQYGNSTNWRMAMPVRTLGVY